MMKKYPHTIYEIFRETYSTVPEKSDKEIYFPKTEEVSGIYLLSGRWLNLESPWINVGPLGQHSIMGYTDPDTLRFKVPYSEEDNYIQGLFSENKSLLEIDSLPITPGISSMSYIFYGCENLETLNLKGLDFSGVHEWEVSFQDCSSLKNILGPFTGICRSIDLSYSPLLTLESILTVFDALVTDFDNYRYVNVSPETYNLLNQTHLSIPESKGWEVIVA